MTSTEELLSGIESDRFSALVNVASNLKTFFRALDAQPEVRQLAAAMASPEARAAVLARVTQLADKEFDDRYENPCDAALAAYLWLLSRADPEAAALAGASVGTCSGCWWADKVMEKVLAAPPRPTDGVAGSDADRTAPAKMG